MIGARTFLSAANPNFSKDIRACLAGTIQLPFQRWGMRTRPIRADRGLHPASMLSPNCPFVLYSLLARNRSVKRRQRRAPAHSQLNRSGLAVDPAADRNVRAPVHWLGSLAARLRLHLSPSGPLSLHACRLSFYGHVGRAIALGFLFPFANQLQARQA